MELSFSWNKYPHHSGHGGYALVEQQMEEELGHELTEYDRAEMWTRARMNKKWDVIDEEARGVVKNIVSILRFFKIILMINVCVKF